MRKVVKIFKQMLKIGSSPSTESNIKHTPTIIPRNQHTISRSEISKSALKVLYRLHKAGFAAYLVGGSVRDLLLGLHPKDFDVVTDAHPEQIQRLFSNSFIIGRRFKLVHVRFGSEIIEVATFRGATHSGSGRVHTQHGQILRDNVYGTLEDDVWRRDFTVNALYYNIADFSVVDYAGGMGDLKAKMIKVIGDSSSRYREDPARMLRAIRLAGKLNFSIDQESSKTIREQKELLAHIPPARLFDKLLKIFHSGKSLAIFELLKDYNLFSVLFPQAAQSIKEETCRIFFEETLKNTDERIENNKNINSSFILAVILWCPVQIRKESYLKKGNLNQYQAFHHAITEVIQEQLETVAIPRRFTLVIKEIWQLQYHLEHAKPRRVYMVFHHLRFRAAYDFLVLRCLLDKSLEPLCQWWQAFQEADEQTRSELIATRFTHSKSRKRKRKRKSNDQSISSVGE